MQEIVILLGGGDAGAIVITPHGIKRIGPWGPDVLVAARAIGALAALGEKSRFAPQARELSAAMVEDLRALAGVSAEAGIGLLADVDDWYCGNGQRFPVPVPRPHQQAVTETVAVN